VLNGKNQLALVEQASGRIAWRVTLGDDIGWFRFDDGMLWVQFSEPSTASASAGRAEPDRLVRLDADTGRRRDEVALGEPGVTGMATVGHDLWIATPSGKIVVVR
jgi:hypothetical protein